MGVLTPMRSIWESVARWLAEADDASEYEIQKRLKKAHAAMAAKGLDPHDSGDQRRRDAMARIMQDPEAAKLVAQPGEWEDELPGTSQLKGVPDAPEDELPKPVQGAPGTASGIGAGRIAAKNADPTSVSLGAKAKRFDPGVSGIKQQLGISPDVYFGDAPVKVDPTTGKFRDIRGRHKKPDEKSMASVEAEIEKLQKLLQNPKTDRHAEWLANRIKEKEAELEKLQNAPAPEVVHEPFAQQQAAAMAANTAKKPVDKSKIKQYDAGAFKDKAGGPHLPKSGTVRQTGKDANIGTSKAASSKLTSTDDAPRPGGFLGQRFAPAGHSTADDEEWADNPELAVRRMGGKGASRLSYARQDVGQRGRMSVKGSPGAGSEVTYNTYTGEWETPEQMAQSLQRPDIKAQIAAKLALRGADIANKRFGQERRPHAGRASAEPLGSVIPKDANTQKSNDRAAAIASKPLGTSTRRDDEPKKQYKKEPEPQGQSTSSASAGPIDRDAMKKMITQRIANMAAKKKG